MSERIPLDAPLPDGTRHAPLQVPPSYHDLHITTEHIPRTSIFNLPYGYEVACTRVTGWQLWKFRVDDARKAVLVAAERGVLPPAQRGLGTEHIAGEYDHDWLVLDVGGHVIVDSRNTEEKE